MKTAPATRTARDTSSRLARLSSRHSPLDRTPEFSDRPSTRSASLRWRRPPLEAREFARSAEMLKGQSSQSRPHSPRPSQNGMASSRIDPTVPSAIAAPASNSEGFAKVRKSALEDVGKSESAYIPYVGSLFTESWQNHDMGLAAARCGCRQWEKTRTRPAAFTPAHALASFAPIA